MIYVILPINCTGVDSKNNNRFSSESPGTRQQLFMLSWSTPNMKYIITTMHGNPNIKETKNECFHFLMSDL